MSVTQWQWQWRLETHTDELVATGTSTNIVYSLCCILYSGIMKANFFFHIYWHDRSGQSVRHMWLQVLNFVFSFIDNILYICVYIYRYMLVSAHTWYLIYAVCSGALLCCKYIDKSHSDFLSRILSGHWWVGVKIHNLQSWIFNLYAHKNRQWTIIFFQRDLYCWLEWHIEKLQKKSHSIRFE